MNAEKLNEIKERAEKATSGPWEADLSRVYYGEENDELVCEIWKSFEDAEFIAHAREDIPALVAEVERLRSVIWRISSLYDISVEETSEFLAKGER